MEDAVIDQLSRRLGRTLDRRRAGGLVAGVIGALAGLVAPKAEAGAREVGATRKPTKEQKEECKETAAGCRLQVSPSCSLIPSPGRRKKCEKKMRECCNLIAKCKNKKKVLRCFAQVPKPPVPEN